jgi:hypothetical protein
MIPRLPFAADSERFNGTQSAFLGGDVTIDGCGEMSQYSVASEDRLLTTAQCGDQQAFIELCRRHAAAVKKRIFSIVRNQEDTEDRFRILCSVPMSSRLKWFLANERVQPRESRFEDFFL